MFYHILFVNETILLYVGFYGLYTGYGFFFVDRSPSCRYSIPFKIIIEVISVYFFCHDVIRTLLIHHINRIAFEECLDVGGYLLVQALASLVGGPGNVRGEVGIRLVPERIVL